MAPITTIEQATQAGAQDAVQGAGSYAANQPAPVRPINPVINAADIANVPSPYKLAPATTPSAAAGLMGSVEATNQQAQQNIAPLIDQAAIEAGTQTKQSLFKQLLPFFDKSGKTAQTDQAYAQNDGTGSVDQNKQELTDITNQINSRTLAYRREIEQLQKNPNGALEGGVNIQVNEVQKKAAQELADLSIIQSAKSNNYANAKEIADRKVAASLEDDQNKLKALQFFYDENKQDLSKKEDQKFQLLISERSRLLNTQEEDKKTVNSLAIEALKNGAPQSVAQAILKSTDPQSAISAAGRYVADPLDRQLKQAQLASAYQSIANSKLDNSIKQLSLNGTKAIPGQAPAGKPDPQVATYANRAVAADSILENLSSTFSQVNPGTIAGGTLPTYLQSQDRKSFEQAKTNFATAVLRRESGAAISKSEFDDVAKVYFPAPGDSESVLNQKANARVAAMNGLIGSSGTAYAGTYKSPKLDTKAFSLVQTPKGQIDLSAYEQK